MQLLQSTISPRNLPQMKYRAYLPTAIPAEFILPRRPPTMLKPNHDITPPCYLSTSRSQWRIIWRGQTLCADKATAAEALAAAKQLKVIPDAEWFWNGEKSRFDPIPAPRRVDEAAFFTLEMQPANPQTDTTLPLF
jgi:hypothetical protein